ncbi:MAG: hypothetical protein K0S47_377 [Herbinix sp.]|jgi:small GTP-binding protein|nr:hypothetical protein [Herbinix sp.]
MDKLQDRFVLDYEDVEREINLILDYVKELRNDSFIKRILSKADRDAILRWESLIKEKLDEEFSVVVIGDFKRGKSTFINSLLGKDLVTTNVTPETVTINRISFGTEPKMEAVLENGKRFRLDKNELSREELEKIIAELPGAIDYIDIKDNNDILKEIAIVDTPGIGDILKAYDQKVMNYLIKADAVIYLVSALSPISETEQIFLNTAVLPHSFSRIFVVINMVDCIDEVSDIARIKNAINDKVKAITRQANVFTISGLDEFCRKTDQKRPNPALVDFLEANYEEFETAIQSDIVIQKMVIKSERVIQTVKQMVVDIEGRIKLISNMLSNSKEELDQLETKYEQENIQVTTIIKHSSEALHEEIKRYSIEAKDWMSLFLDRLKQELESIGQSQTTETLQKHLQFYLSDHVKEAILLCVKAHRDKIEQKINEIARDYSKSLADIVVSINKFDMNFLLSDISWTGVDSATFVLNEGLTMMGMQSFGVIGMAIAGYLRQNRMSKKQQDLLQPILTNFNKVTQDVFMAIDKTYEEIEKNALKILEQAYRGQLEKSLNAVKQAQDVSKTENIKSEEVKEQIANAMEIIFSIHKSLEKF